MKFLGVGKLITMEDLGGSKNFGTSPFVKNGPIKLEILGLAAGKDRNPRDIS